MKTSWWQGVAGVAAACGLIGFGVVGGMWLVPSGRLPLAHALSAQADDSFAVCTAPVDGLNEGFFILDFETGDLSGGVINANAQKFVRSYRSNVLKDLGFKIGKVKKPRFMLLSGVTAFAGPASNTFGASVLYVTDAATGVTVAYGIPWNPQQAGVPGIAEFVPLDIARPRGGS
jgi:hypothetical protein